MREIIVVGAGPAGATTAIALSRMGHDVLLVDRRKFPRDKACGDAVPGRAIDILNRLGVKESHRRSFYPIRNLRVISAKGRPLDVKLSPSPLGTHSCVVPRLIFDALLQEHAVESGAEFIQGRVTAPLVEDGRVRGVHCLTEGQPSEIRSRIVIGADGAASAIARIIRPEGHPDRHRAVAVRGYFESSKELLDRVDFYLYRKILPGYAWVFPTERKKANIGIGMRLDELRRRRHRLRTLLHDFLQLPDIRKNYEPTDVNIYDIAGWSLNFASYRSHIAFEGALLVGDAAGLANPLTGGGLLNAIISAEAAAEVANVALAEGDVSRTRLQVYEQLCRASLQRRMNIANVAQKVLLRYPQPLDWAIRLANNRLFQTMAGGILGYEGSETRITD